MDGSYSFKRLSSAILALSSATDWELARKEWALIDVIDSDVIDSEECDECLCGKKPIFEICIIENKITKKQTEVGNHCVKRFLGVRSDRIFSAIKRIKKDPIKSLNEDAIVFFRQKGLLNNREYQFLQDVRNKRDLSEKQLSWRRDINHKILAAIARKGFQGPS